jgi:hypothetical protein
VDPKSFNIKSSEAFQALLAESIKLTGSMQLASPKNSKHASVISSSSTALPSLAYMKSKNIVMKMQGNPLSPK